MVVEPTGRAGSDAARSVIRIVIVAALTAWSLATTLPDIALPWHPFGSFGFFSDLDGNVTEVFPGYAAAQAGMRVGDRVDLPKTPFESRRYIGLTYAATFQAGVRATFVVDRGDASTTMTLVSKTFTRSAADNISDVAIVLAQSILVLIGASLVLLRPSLTTWAFFGYGLSVGGGAILALTWPLSASGALVESAITVALYAAGPVAFVIFALRFPRDQSTKAGAIAEAILLPLLLAAIAAAEYQQIAQASWGIRTGWLSTYFFAFSLVCYAAGIVAFVATYLRSRSDDRPRIRWVMLGFGIAFASSMAVYALYQSSLIVWSHPIWLLNVLQIPVILPALTVAYAVVRHRVIDVRFVLSRALVYATLTTILVGAFALIDWVLGQALAQTKLALAAEIVTALAAGFSLDGLHRVVDRNIDRMLFHRRYVAERHLGRIALGLPHAKSERVVGQMLVEEVVQSYELVSAALFCRSSDGVFERAQSIGWSETNAKTLDLDDPVILQLHGDASPLPISPSRWHRSDLPAERECPVLAVPITMRHVLAAIVFYGPHRSGEDLDPDEVKAVSGMAVAAGAAFDHLDAEKYRRKNETLAMENDLLRRQLASGALRP
jgi:hypothetical protein